MSVFQLVYLENLHLVIMAMLRLKSDILLYIFCLFSLFLFSCLLLVPWKFWRILTCFIYTEFEYCFGLYNFLVVSLDVTIYI